MNAEAWNRLEHQALWHLEHADQTAPRDITRGMALQLRLWRYLHSGSFVSWSLILPVRDYRIRRGITREVTWDRPEDWSRRTAPVDRLKRRQPHLPSIHSRDAEVQWLEVAPFLLEAGGWAIPGPQERPTRVLGQDVYGIEGHRSLSHLQLEWTGRVPRGSAEIVAAVTKFRRLLENCIQERANHATPS